jgi:hypothetical protein
MPTLNSTQINSKSRIEMWVIESNTGRLRFN